MGFVEPMNRANPELGEKEEEVERLEGVRMLPLHLGHRLTLTG
jgi:hypothetical protein